MTRVRPPHHLAGGLRGLSGGDLARADMGMLLVIVALSALVGAFFSERYGLGKGSRGFMRSRAGLAILGGFAAAGLTVYFALGWAFEERPPTIYPDEVAWALVMVAKGAFFEEVVARYGMMTMLVGATSRVWLANGLQAIFFSALSLKLRSFAGLAFAVEPVVVVGLLVSLAFHLALGAVYARRGLVAAMAAHALYDLRFVVHAMLA